MVRLRRGRVLRVTGERPGAVELEIHLEGAEAAALAYPDLTGPVAAGDEVLVNSTAVELGLGTGGVHLVVAVTSREPAGGDASGRVMKARYTPLQTAIRSVEETHPAELEATADLGGTPVVAAPLHSMVAPIAAGAKAAGAERVIYLMTDGAALPGAFSRLVPALRGAGLLDGFVTSGQAFGGEVEAVTTWSGLLGATTVLGADVVVVADGPGNLGTETTWGVSALRSGESLNAAGMLGGRPVAAIRISFADPRERHRGLSHHTATVLSRICLVPATVAVPILDDDGEREAIWSALRAFDARAPLDFVEADGSPALELLHERGVAVQSMGRGAGDDPAFFLAAGAAGAVAAGLRPQRSR